VKNSYMSAQVIVVLCLSCSSVSAEDTVLSEIKSNVTSDEIASLNTIGPNSKFSGSRSSLNLDISEDKMNASLKFGNWSLNNKWKTSIEIKGAFDKDKGETVFATLDGLQNATTITLGFDTFRFSFEETTKERVNDEKNLLCEKYMYESQNSNCTAIKVEEEAKAYFTNKSMEVQQQLCRCSVPNADDFAKSTKEEFKKKIREIFGPTTTGFFVPIRLTAGNQSYSYHDEMTLQSKKTNKDVYAASIGFGWMKYNTFIGGGYEYQQAYESQPSKQLCIPVIDSPLIECVTGPIGAPAKVKRQNLFLETRYKAGQTFAIGLKVTRDTKASETSFELPIYIIGSNKDINTGVILAWNSESKEVVSSLFFGSAFKFF